MHTRPPELLPGTVLMLFALAFSASQSRAQDVHVVVNEVHYHPADGSRDGEFIELHNFHSRSADVGNWLLTGAVTFQIPSGTTIPGNGYLVVARNRDVIIDRYGLDPRDVVGNYNGTLDNVGELLQLFTAGGYLISFVHYRDSAPWPESADGLGPSLERLSATLEDADPRSWGASLFVGGTPLKENSLHAGPPRPPEESVEDVIPAGAEWSFLPGESEPPAGWNEVGFDDEEWNQGPAGFGYDDGDDATLLLDMEGSYSSVYVRRSFSISSPAHVHLLTFHLSYDDGYVAYLNGVEIGRANVPGTPGTRLPHDRLALETIGLPAVAQIDLAPFFDALVPGENVIAVQGVNGLLSSDDFSLHPSLTGAIDPGGGSVNDFVIAGDSWSYRLGNSPPPDDWNSTDFNDFDWEQGPSGFGFGDGDDATAIPEMRNSALTVYIRRRFVVTDTSRVESLELSVDYDDGFVAYINGEEIARSNVTDDDFDDPSTDSHEAGTPEIFTIENLADVLHDGINVIALQGHNDEIGSSDFSLAPTLHGFVMAPDGPGPGEDPVPAPRDLVINEVFPSGDGTGWVELHNPTDSEIDASGRRLIRYPSSFGEYTLAPGSTLPADGFLLVSEVDLGFELEAVPAVVLMTTDGRYIDGLNPRSVPEGHSSGRFPDGSTTRFVFDAPSPAATNTFTSDGRIVINEIHYHPSSDFPSTEFIELHNRSTSAVELGDWSFTRGVSFTFGPDASIPAAGFVVIARDPAALIAAFDTPPDRVFGPYVGALHNDAETVLLRDPLNNPADRVRYADEGSWPEETDGLGPSAELRHPAIENRYGPAWEASDGNPTPGEMNSRRTADVAPIVVNVSHAPIIPRTTDNVRVLATASDEDSISSVTLFFENDSAGGDADQIPMRDDGLQDDGIAGNGVYGAVIPPQGNGDVVAFWLRARAPGNQETIVPTGAPDPAFLYHVENEPPESAREIYRIVMREDDLTTLRTRRRSSDDLLDSTFIANGHAYYNRGVRLRGSSARNCLPRSYRVQFDHDVDFDGTKRVNLNGCNVHQQWIGYDFLRRTGLPTPLAWFRLLSFNGDVEDDFHLRIEAIDDQFLERTMAGDDDGNLYRGEDQANLDYRGDSPSRYRNHYPKLTNRAEDDYTDLIDLCYHLDADTTPDEEFPDAVEELLDTQEWALYFAAFACLGSGEGSLLLDRGDDYFLYRRFSDNRWVLLPWDLDSCFEEENQQLFRPTVDSVERFLEHVLYAPDYWCNLEWLIDNVFDPVAINSRIDHLAPLVSQSRVRQLRTFVDQRYQYIVERLHRDLEITQVDRGRFCNGLIEARQATLGLHGTAPACRTSEVRVNDQVADFDQLRSTWSADFDVDGVTMLEITTRDRYGDLAGLTRIPFADISNVTGLFSTIRLDTTLRRENSPYRAGTNVTVPPGVTLVIEPGVEVLFDDDASLLIRGSLVAEGTESEPVLFRPDDCGDTWEGIVFLPESSGNRLGYCEITGATLADGNPAALTIDNSDVVIENIVCSVESNAAIHVRNGGHVELVESTLRSLDAGLLVSSSTASVRSCRFDGLPGTAVTIDGADAQDVSIASSIFARCGVALDITDGAHAILQHLTIWDCFTGIALREDSNGEGSGTATADSVILWDSKLPLVTISETDIEISYSDSSSNLPPDHGNISADPLFVDAADGDFRLRANSPCRSTGKDGTDMGAVPWTPSDDPRSFVQCDSNGDGVVDVSDSVHSLRFLFASGDSGECEIAADCNADGELNVSDAVYRLSHLFANGPPPRAPYPECDAAPSGECAVDTCLR